MPAQKQILPPCLMAILIKNSGKTLRIPIFSKKIKDINTGKPLSEDNWVWSPTGVINIHYPELWGFVFFCDDKSDTPVIPETELIKWELRKIYYAENAFFDKKGYYTDDKELISTIVKDCSRCEKESEIKLDDYELTVTPTFFEASAFTSDYEKAVRIYADGKTIALPVNKSRV